jgi:hypothetical protein
MGMALVESDGEAEFGTLQGVVRVFCPMQGGIEQWERGHALCIHRADLLYAVKYIGFMYTQGDTSQIKILD